MNSAASRLLTFNSKASLQSLIQRHLLRRSAVADGSVTQLLNKVTEPPLTSHFSSENRTPYLLNTLQTHSFHASDYEAMKKYSSGRDLSMIMFGKSGINQSENVKIHVRRRDDTDDDDSDNYSDDTDDDFDNYPTADSDYGDDDDDN